LEKKQCVLTGRLKGLAFSLFSNPVPVDLVAPRMKRASCSDH
jgi:hypothetical protein